MYFLKYYPNTWLNIPNLCYVDLKVRFDVQLKIQCIFKCYRWKPDLLYLYGAFMNGFFNSSWCRGCGKTESRYIGERLNNKEHTSACLCAGVYSRQNDEQSSHPPTAIKALLYRQAMQFAEYFPLRPFLFMFAHSCKFDDKPEQPAIVYTASCGVSCQFISYLTVQSFSTGNWQKYIIKKLQHIVCSWASSLSMIHNLFVSSICVLCYWRT
jgi:hypothetical protein